MLDYNILMTLRDKIKYKTRIGKWWYKLDAECKVVLFSLLNMALALSLWAWHEWLR